MYHLWKKNENAEFPDQLKAWCGRSVHRNTAVTTLTHVSCQQCREAFARTLRALPDVHPSVKRKEP